MNTSSSPISGLPNATIGGITRGGGGLSIIALPFALIIGIIGMVAVGAALFFSGKYLIYLICLSVVIATALAGGVAILVVSIGKVRNTLIGFLLGALIGIGAYGIYRGAEYVDIAIEEGNFYRQELRNVFARQGATASDAEIEDMLNQLLEEETGATGIIGLIRSIDLFLQEEVGSTGFFGFVQYQAKVGFGISRATSSIGSASPSSSLEIKDGLAWIYWRIELLIFGVGAGLMAAGRASSPFCQDQGRWLTYRPIGQVSTENREQFLTHFQNGEMREASALLSPVTGGNFPKLWVEAGRCSPESSDGLVKITAMTSNNNNDKQVIFDDAVQQLNLLAPR